MHYDASLIETSTITVDGKDIPFHRVPAGMSGPNGAPAPITEDERETTGFDPVIAKELESYINDGEDPDSDEVRAIKEEIEKEQSEDFLESLSVEDNWEL